jgi:hypothetical protein
MRIRDHCHRRICRCWSGSTAQAGRSWALKSLSGRPPCDAWNWWRCTPGATAIRRGAIQGAPSPHRWTGRLAGLLSRRHGSAHCRAQRPGASPSRKVLLGTAARRWPPRPRRQPWHAARVGHNGRNRGSRHSGDRGPLGLRCAGTQVPQVVMTSVVDQVSFNSCTPVYAGATSDASAHHSKRKRLA